MGCMVMGGLIVNYVKAMWIKDRSSTTTYSIQTNFLDQVCPSILPLAVTLLVYYLMNKTLVFLKNHWTDRSDRGIVGGININLSILEI